MTRKRTAVIRVQGASLHCDVAGDGPTLLLISPGLGDSGFHARLADLLADTFRVVTFDRRGNSRSLLEDPRADLDVAEHASDARHVIEQLGTAPAHVFGGSGGAIIALDLMTRHPGSVRMLVAHEPPVVRLLPEAAAMLAFFEDVHQTHITEGPRPAMQKFSAAYQEPGTPFDFDPDLLPDPEFQSRLIRNRPYFFEHEMRSFAGYEVEIDRLAARRDRIVLGAGADSIDRYPARCAAALSEALGTRFALFPGGHTGYLERPRQFAETLRGILLPSSD